MTGSNAIFCPGKRGRLMSLLIAHFTTPLTISLMIDLQVVRTSFGFHLRECIGSCFPSPSPPPPLEYSHVNYLCVVTKGSKFLHLGHFISHLPSRQQPKLVTAGFIPGIITYNRYVFPVSCPSSFKVPAFYKSTV